MAISKLARDYAKALMSLSEHNIQQVHRDFKVITGLWSRVWSDCVRFLDSTAIERRRKLSLLSTLEENFDPPTMALLNHLVDGGKIRYLKSIIRQFRRLYKPIHIYVTSPLPLPEWDYRRLETIIRQDIQKVGLEESRIEFHYKVESVECASWTKEIVKSLIQRQIEFLEQT
jgi:F0F1-type ATP synthase delta subunit